MNVPTLQRLRIAEASAVLNSESTAISAVLGTDLQFDRGALERCMSSKLEEVDSDLLTVLAAIAFADRRVSRRRGTRWARHLHVSVPVHLRSCWESQSPRLSTLLQYLTGDVWSFEFRMRCGRDELLQQFLPGLAREFVGATILPYSGGLDSFAALARHQAATGGAPILLVHAKHGSYSLASVLPARGAVIPALAVPFTIAAGRHAEPSYRTRTLIFFAIAALACRKASGSSICIGESGIGCLGPGFAPFGIEHPYRGCHPAFLSHLAEFLFGLWGERPVFDLPHLWQTKAEVLAQLREMDASEGWERTRSCSRNVRRQHPGTPATHCGLCSGCLYRRQSLTAANLDEASEAYFVDVVTRAEVDPESKRSDREVGAYAVVGLDSLAGLSSQIREHRGAIFEIETALRQTADQVTARVERLFGRHQMEWDAFTAALPPTSWVRRIASFSRGAA